MPYLGNPHIVGDSVNNFKVLDDISTYTATFDGSASSVVNPSTETIKIVDHRFVNGQRVTYNNGGGSNIGGLTSGTAYYVIYDTAHTIKLATNASNASSLTAINLNAVGGGTSHTLNAAFDGVNKKFRVTHGSGNRPRFHHATQLSIAINNVVQRPNNDANNFTEGYAIEVRDIIVFKTAPTVNDIFFGSLTGETRATFDITDHKIDNYTGDGSTVEFSLSQNVPNAESLLVSLNGVIQHPTDASTTRSYSLLTDNVITFTTAPALGVEIQIRHLGFAGASSGDVSGFYGRTGNVSLTDADNIVVNTAKVGGATTFTEDLVVTGNARVTGILTVGTGSLTISERDINAIGIVTGSNFKTGTTNVHNVGVEAAGINVLGADTPIGTGATIYNSGDVVSKAGAEYQGIVTASKFVGDGSDLTGVSGFSTALSNTANTLENLVFKTPHSFTLGAGTSVTIESDETSGFIAFTRLNQIIVSSGATFRVKSGTRFMMDILNLNP